MPKEIALAPKLPWQCEHAWSVYVRLADTSYQEIKAYIELTGDFLDDWEIEIFKALDVVKNGGEEWRI